MAAVGPVLLQLAPILLPIFAPLLTGLIAKLLRLFGAKVPSSALPAVNAVIGAVAAGLAGGVGDASTGALVAHVVRSGLAHEPAAPSA